MAKDTVEACDTNVPNALYGVPKYLGNQRSFFGHGQIGCPGADHRDGAADRWREFMAR